MDDSGAMTRQGTPRWGAAPGPLVLGPPSRAVDPGMSFLAPHTYVLVSAIKPLAYAVIVVPAGRLCLDRA